MKLLSEEGKKAIRTWLRTTAGEHVDYKQEQFYHNAEYQANENGIHTLHLGPDQTASGSWETKDLSPPAFWVAINRKSFDVDQLTEDALNALCLSVQRAVGQSDGGYAAMFWDDERRELIEKYVTSEINMSEPSEDA